MIGRKEGSMKRIKSLISILLILGMTAVLAGCTVSLDGHSATARGTDQTDHEELSDSPEWIGKLDAAKNAEQLFVAAGVGDTTVYVSMHQKDQNGNWKEIMTTPGYMGKNGLGKTKEGDGKTPVGVFRFTKAFGIADDPGCSMPYQKVTEDDYWSSDKREGFHYNEMVSIKDFPDLDTDDSEHIIDYTDHYQYCLNIGYNEEGEPGKGSGIFLHCFGPSKPYTRGCITLPKEQMRKVMQNVDKDCVVVIDHLKNLNPDLYKEWGLGDTASAAGLEYWSEDSAAAASIRDYVARVTDQDSDAFIPVEGRIAVFDLDGTLIGELYPSYFEYMMFIHRALHDDTYDAPDDMRAFAQALEAGVYDGNKPDDHERLHAKYAGEAYAGMTPDELRDYTRKFMESEADGFKNLTRGDAFYKPMVSLVEYLKANDFTVYIVSGSDRTVVRELVKDKLGVPENRVIGMSYTMVADHQDGTDGLEYIYTKDDNVILGGDLIIKTIKMNKVSAIAEEIGKVPVLSFGNTAGDQSMAQYTVNNDRYETKAYMLMCDDLIREHGNMEKADEMKQMCEECGFEPISMRDDFATIYGDDVEVVDYEELEVEEALEPAA